MTDGTGSTGRAGSQAPVGGLPGRLFADGWLMDRQIIDADGLSVARVDDLEFTDPEPGRCPVLTGLLCGPTAFGPRLGGRLGVWWTVIGARLRATGDLEPIRIRAEDVRAAEPAGLRLRVTRERTETQRLRDWTVDKIIRRLPGGRT